MKTWQYVIAALIAAAIVVALAFCSGHSEEEAEEPLENTPQVLQLPKGFSLAGEWYDRIGEKATMKITEGEGDQAYNVEIIWPDGETEVAVWTFSGTFDPETGYLYYQDGRKAHRPSDEYAGTGEETTDYNGGAGALLYYDEALIWQDNEEDAGADCRFVKMTKKKNDTQEPL